MLERLRRRAKPVPTPPAPVAAAAETDPREEARRLLALLEAHPEGLSALGRSRELKAVAAELIRRVEDGRAAADPAPPAAGPVAPMAAGAALAPTPAHPAAAPAGAARPHRAVAPAREPSAVPARTGAPAPDRARLAAARLRSRLAAPAALTRPPATTAPDGPPARPADTAAPPRIGELVVAHDTVRRLARRAAEEGRLGEEHPAIVALALSGRPRREQAMALRAMSGPQARAVHRLLAP